MLTTNGIVWVCIGYKVKRVGQYYQQVQLAVKRLQSSMFRKEDLKLKYTYVYSLTVSV